MTVYLPVDCANRTVLTTPAQFHVIDHLNGAEPMLEARPQEEGTFAQLAVRGTGTHIVRMVRTGQKC